jgi:hypothetical protein
MYVYCIYTSITCSKIEHIPYNVISTTKCNISSILITNISWDYFSFVAMVIFGNENDYTTDFYASDSFIVYLSGLVLRRKDKMTLSAQFSNSGEIITY